MVGIGAGPIHAMAWTTGATELSVRCPMSGTSFDRKGTGADLATPPVTQLVQLVATTCFNSPAGCKFWILDFAGPARSSHRTSAPDDMPAVCQGRLIDRTRRGSRGPP